MCVCVCVCVCVCACKEKTKTHTLTKQNGGIESYMWDEIMEVIFERFEQ